MGGGEQTFDVSTLFGQGRHCYLIRNSKRSVRDIRRFLQREHYPRNHHRKVSETSKSVTQKKKHYQSESLKLTQQRHWFTVCKKCTMRAVANLANEDDLRAWKKLDCYLEWAMNVIRRKRGLERVGSTCTHPSDVKILALSVFGILLARVRRSSRLLKIVFPLLSPLSLFSSTEGKSFRQLLHFPYSHVLVTVSRIVRQVNTVRSLRLRLQSHALCAR